MVGPAAQAQFLKKLKKTAENAVEKTVLKKTDQGVSQKTGEVIDETVSGEGDGTKSTDSGTPSPENTQNPSEEGAPKENTPQTPEQKAKTEKMMSMFGGGLEDVPESYVFSYVLTYQIQADKDQMAFSYLLEPDAAYLGNDAKDPRNKSIMVYDFKKNFMINFMENGEQKIAMKMKLPQMKKIQERYGEQLFSEDQEDVQIIPIEGKTILGYECLGYKLITKEGENKIWFTNDAPVSPNSVFAKIKKMPEKSPYTKMPISEKSLILEMDFQSNKKKKDNMHMLCTELVKKSFEIQKKDYNTGM